MNTETEVTTNNLFVKGTERYFFDVRAFRNFPGGFPKLTAEQSVLCGQMGVSEKDRADVLATVVALDRS